MCEKKVRKNEIFDKMQHVTKKVLDIINIVIMNQDMLNILNYQRLMSEKKQKRANPLKIGDAKPRI